MTTTQSKYLSLSFATQTLSYSLIPLVIWGCTYLCIKLVIRLTQRHTTTFKGYKETVMSSLYHMGEIQMFNKPCYKLIKLAVISSRDSTIYRSLPSCLG